MKEREAPELNDLSLQTQGKWACLAYLTSLPDAFSFRPLGFSHEPRAPELYYYSFLNQVKQALIKRKASPLILLHSAVTY